MLRQSLDPSKLMDPRKVLMKRYQMMGLHIGMIIALIAVSATEVRSAILLGIHGTSCLFFLIYIPRAAYLSYKRSRTTETTVELAKGARDVHGARMNESRWDAAASEVGYLGWQCSTTLVSSVLCTMSLRSDQCYGTSHWALDEFAEIRERDVDDWCQGVIGATVLSYTQLVLDLTWLGWVVWLARSAGDVVDVQQRQMRSEGVEGDMEARGSEGSNTTTNTLHNRNAINNHANANNDNNNLNDNDDPPPTHAQKVLAALRMPVPLILLKLAAHRSEQEIIRLENIIARNRSRMAAARYAPMRNANNNRNEQGERRVEPDGTAHLEAGENVHSEQGVWVHRDQGMDYVRQTPGQEQGGLQGGYDARYDQIAGILGNFSNTNGAHLDAASRHHQQQPPCSHQANAHDSHNLRTVRDRDTTLGYREVPPPYIGKEGGAPGYVTPGRELEEGVFFGSGGNGGTAEAVNVGEDAGSLERRMSEPHRQIQSDGHARGVQSAHGPQGAFGNVPVYIGDAINGGGGRAGGQSRDGGV